MRKPSSRPNELEAPLKSTADATRKAKARGLTLRGRVRGLEQHAQTARKLEAYRRARPYPKLVAWAKTHFEANRELYQWLAKL